MLSLPMSLWADDMACIKIGHQTRDDAFAHIKSLVWRNHATHQSERSAGLGAYRCDQCGLWHVGHQEASPLIWHYTVKLYLAAILEADALTPAQPRVASRVSCAVCRRSSG